MNNILITGGSSISKNIINKLSLNKNNNIIYLTRNLLKNDLNNNNNIVGIECDLLLNNNEKLLLKKINQGKDQLKKQLNLNKNEKLYITNLINCAGINDNNLLIKQNDKIINDIIQLNLIIPIILSKVIYKDLIINKNNDNKSIINIGSIIGSNGNIGQTIYSSSKSGLIGFTKSLSKELGKKNIRVNLIEPGFIENTEMTKDLNNNNDILKNITLNRYGTKNDITNLIEFLISKKSSYITGQVLKIDGGLII